MIKIYLSRVMKTIMCLMLTGFMSVSAASYSQQITLKGRNIPFERVIDAIRKQSGYTVFGTKKLIESARPISIDVKDMPLRQFLNKVTEVQLLDYVIEDRTISLSSPQPGNTAAAAPQAVQQQLLNGTVRNSETRVVLAGATVKLKGSSLTSMTNEKGQYRISIPLSEQKQTLVFSYIGMTTQEVTYQKQEILNVELEPDNEAMNEVVVTGIYQRDRESFTGSSARYTAKDLQIVGNQSIIQSLKTLDPAFAVIDNNQFGSDPNRLPDIEIRGKSSVIGLTDEFSSNPNQPLFILDGFETTLAIISDLSMDRVASITLLKDASASAIYGSKAANGVVVVETKRPAAGSLRINYNFNSTVNFADLTDYNLMNGEEKLQFERISLFYGLLNADGDIIVGANPASEANYFARLKEVRSGVNTYWANEPLRTTMAQRHTLFAEGGDANLRYSVSLNYGLTPGVMKGSDRTATNGNVRLLYRRGNVSFTNTLSIDNVVANREPQPFSDFSRANPYYRKYDEQGNVRMILEDFKARGGNEAPIYSPLYNQSNLNINTSESEGFTNNFETEWRLMESLRARARFGLRSLRTKDEIFRSPFNTEFMQTDVLQRGKYDESNGKNVNYDGDLSLTFGKQFAAKHMINAVAGMRMEQNVRNQSSFGVSGFIDDEFSNPNFALGYRAGQRAGYQESKRRSASFFMNMGYSYDQRYLLDATLRSDGSSIYGSSRQFSNIWSIGLAWNAHKESFLSSYSWINQLRLRGSIGNPGNQNFDDYISMRIYRYNNENRNPFGASTIISNMGNSNLRWQTTLDRNIGMDFSTLENKFRLTVDYFVKNTDPLLILLTLPSSTGIARVAQNFGEQQTNGLNLTTDYTLLHRADMNWRVNLNLRHERVEYRKMGNQLNNFNLGNRSLNMTRYYDGGSPTDLWSVRSLGIDPATGREIFLNKNNEQTFVYNYEDEVVVGNSRPGLDGVIGTSFMYKGFLASVNLRYRLGGQEFLKTLYDKVENIGSQSVVLNQDKRALYDRWQKPGDNARFKSISTTEYTPMSSRFVADNNMLVGESFSLGYETSKASWLRAVRASSITFRAYMNDIFYVSTIKNERGLDYPFARSVSFSAAVRF